MPARCLKYNGSSDGIFFRRSMFAVRFKCGQVINCSRLKIELWALLFPLGLPTWVGEGLFGLLHSEPSY